MFSYHAATAPYDEVICARFTLANFAKSTPLLEGSHFASDGYGTGTDTGTDNGTGTSIGNGGTTTGSDSVPP